MRLERAHVSPVHRIVRGREVSAVARAQTPLVGVRSQVRRQFRQLCVQIEPEGARPPQPHGRGRACGSPVGDAGDGVRRRGRCDKEGFIPCRGQQASDGACDSCDARGEPNRACGAAHDGAVHGRVEGVWRRRMTVVRGAVAESSGEGGQRRRLQRGEG
eukprot:2605453-Pleurochrysis_carterae.AAC.1